MSLKNCLLAFAGGGLGAMTRYLTALASARLWGTGFPYGTLIVNLAGCFLIGICFSLTEQNRLLSPSARLFLMTGFMGGLTTFSSYGLETMRLVQDGSASLALWNLFINNAGGMACVLLGWWIARAA
ncbi:MAG: fluoride efflux transporter CrcB [bacterium]|nr:fluoride efflux transporter CrcB [bacterium]